MYRGSPNAQNVLDGEAKLANWKYVSVCVWQLNGKSLLSCFSVQTRMKKKTETNKKRRDSVCVADAHLDNVYNAIELI